MTEASPPKPPAIPSASSPVAAPLGRRPSPVPRRAMSEGQKEALAIQALGLLNEQVQARIEQHESHAITAQVVAPLEATPAAFSRDDVATLSPEQIEEHQTRALAQLLPRFFCARGSFATRILEPIGKKVTRLFFESELHEKTKTDEDKVIRCGEQGVFHVLSRYKNRLRAEAEGFDFSGPEVRQATLDLLARTERDLQIAFLSRRSPELNRVLNLYTDVLGDFLQKHLPPRLEQMGKVAIRVSKAARRSGSVGDKVPADAFADFRAEWQRLFMQQLVFFCGDELLDRVTRSSEPFQEEAVELFTDPRVFSETCAVVCEELYDFLSLEGFLDLPLDWRVPREARP